MDFELPFERRKGATFAQNLTPREPNPISGVEYSGDLEADSAAEIEALGSAFLARRGREDDRFRDATDSEYWVAVCFRTRAHKERFLAGLPGLSPIDGDKYLNGHELARRLKIEIESG